MLRKWTTRSGLVAGMLAVCLLTGCGGQEIPQEPPAEVEEAEAFLLEDVDMTTVDQSAAEAARQEAQALVERLSEELVEELVEELSYETSLAKKYYIGNPDSPGEGSCLYIYRLEVTVPGGEDVGDSATIFYLPVEAPGVRIQDGTADLEEPPFAAVSELGLDDIVEQAVLAREGTHQVEELSLD